MPESVRHYTVNVNSTQEMVYRTLRDEIMSMRLKPGTAISTQETAERLDVSRTPVREAFIRLQNECLLSITPQRVTKVAPINLHRVYQERFIREALEIENLIRFIPMSTESFLNKMRQNLEQQQAAMAAKQYLEFIELDNGFHQFPFTATDQELGLNIIRQMNGHYDRIRLITAWEENIALNAIEEHKLLVEFIEHRQTQKAEHLLREHLQQLYIQEGRLKERWADYFDHEV